MTPYVGGTSIQTDYLIDPVNHTGYAQVLEETSREADGQGGWTPISRIQYTIGDDVISQTKSTWTGSAWMANATQYLLYDGHGSTRQLAGPTQTIVDSYSYDAYGVMLGDSTNPNPAQTAATSLLYCGEQYDTSLSQYYLRARYYNPATGRFNRLDPYSGNLHDPQSLHKYAYCHANPVNGIDPSGMMSYVEVSVVVGIMAFVGSIVMGPLHKAIEQTQKAGVAAYQADAVSFLSDGLKTQMERDFLETSDTDLRGMKESFYHELGNGQRIVTYQSYQAKANVLQGIDLAFHSAQIGSLALGAAGGLSTKIVWSKPHGTEQHWSTIVQDVMMQLNKGTAKEIYTNRSLHTITNGRVNSLLRPDRAMITNSGKVDILEIVSPNQTYNQLLEKGWKYKQFLGDDLGYFNVVYPGQVAP